MQRYSKRRRGLKSIVRILTVPVAALACLGGLLYEEVSFRHHQKTAWINLTAVVEETRLRPIARFALEYGSKDLYEIDVLADYSLNGSSQRDWVPLSGAPKSLSDAKTSARLLKGAHCVLSWDPAVPDQKFADVR